MITLTEVKTLLQISDTANDTFITFNIPLVVESICEYCKNHFIDIDYIDNDTYIRSNNVVFANADSSITISDFNNEFIAGDYLRIYGTKRNNGHCKVDSINSTKLVVSEIDIIDETISSNTDNSIVIFRADYPRSLKLPASKLFKYLIDKENPNVKSEKIDDYSITYKDSKTTNGFPAELMESFNTWKKVYFERVFLDNNIYY
jgi:hypothetical protein